MKSPQSNSVEGDLASKPKAEPGASEAKPIKKGEGEKDARWIDIHEGDELDEAQMATWVKQAAALPGWVP